MKKITFFLLFIFCTICVHSQLRNDDVYELPEIDKTAIREIIRIPNIEGYITMKCDLHMHTIFSDGKVWPDVRVNEAWQEGLDAIAITDHIEYRPFKDRLQGDLNESFKIAKKRGDDIGFIVIQGTEITRAKPIGHLNALFIQDANPMDTENPVDAIDTAISQGAFIMWNHPGWPDDKSTFYPIHDTLIKAKKIHGIEVFNYMEYYPETFDWCVQHNLSFMGNSDLHEFIRHDYGNEKLSRPMTIVFATEYSEAGIKEALFAQRSAAYFNGTLAGKPEHLSALVKASLKIKPINIEKGVCEVSNISDIPYAIEINGQERIFPAGKSIRITLPKDQKVKVKNCFIAKNKHLETDLNF